MNERVGREEREKLKRFFPGTRDVLLLSALEGYTGQAYESRDGRSVLVDARNFIFLGGQAQEGFFRQASARLSSGFLTFSGSPAWLSIARQWGAKIAMTRFHLETPETFDVEKLRHLAEKVPPGYEIKIGDEATYDQCLSAAWSEDLAAYYPHGEAFARDGLMAAAYRDGQLAAGCGVYARTADAVEIEIDTHPDHRRQGLALCCAAHFLLRCVQQGLYPHWDAMTPISAALAQKLGFLHPQPYLAQCREEWRSANR